MLHRLKGITSIRLVTCWLALTLLLPIQSFAQDAAATEEGAVAFCEAQREQTIAEDLDGVVLTEAIVNCIYGLIAGDADLGEDGVFVRMIEGLYPAIYPIIQAAITLAVVLTGAGLATGMIEKSSRDTFVVLVKIASVLYFTQVDTVRWVFESGLTSMHDLTTAVFQVGSGDGSGRCADNATLWDRVDCMLDVIIGVRKNEEGVSAEEHQGISRGMIHFFFSNLVSTGVGALIGVLGLYVVYSFLFALIKAVHTYLAAILGLAFVLMFAPLFIPMLLFKSTRQYFDKWQRIALSFVLQPIILFGYLSLMMIAFDKVLVSGEHSVLHIAMEGFCNPDNDLLSDCFEINEILVSQKTEQVHDVSDPKPYADGLDRRLEGTVPVASRDLADAEKADEIMNNLYATTRSFDSISYEALAQAKGVADGQEMQYQLALGAFVLALTAFVFLSMLNYIGVMATDLAGGMFEVPNLYQEVGSRLPGQSQLTQAAGQFSSNIREGGESAAKNFVDRAQDAISRRNR